MFIFSVSGLIGRQQGAMEEHDFDEPFTFEHSDDPTPESNVSGHLTFLKLPHEISVQIFDLHILLKTFCVRCLKPIRLELNVPSAEREYILDLPADQMEEFEEVYYVDKKTNKIDITDMVREEILLHFPPVQVCSPGCKGLCDKCGANRNDVDCGCKREADGEISPFKYLNL
jgi:uncharacterized metal-binding protein YceD (DUF177 family)